MTKHCFYWVCRDQPARLTGWSRHDQPNRLYETFHKQFSLDDLAVVWARFDVQLLVIPYKLVDVAPRRPLSDTSNSSMTISIY